jgi:hypothetical protein
MDPSGGGLVKIASLRRDGSIWRRSGEDVFSRSSREEDDEEALRWAALERLPTYNRVRRGILASPSGGLKEVDVENLGMHEKKSLVERLIRVAEEDNERFLLKLKDRIDRYAFVWICMLNYLVSLFVRITLINFHSTINQGVHSFLFESSFMFNELKFYLFLI